ncbi:MAG: hypothetical protein DRG78_20165 [Epsilonproteobacteria bacterium]|nr:MAG: hypothetical protein DRG78_20165 [Campylobacterota bacterium]
MDLIKGGAIALVGVVVAITGMNQYESYKLNSRANDAIDTIKEKVDNQQKEDFAIVKCSSKISGIRSSLAILKAEAFLDGTDLFPLSSISSSEFSLFDEIEEYPTTPSEEVGGWSKTGEHSYRCVLENEKTVEFEYDNLNGKFECVSNCSKFGEYL